MVLFELLKSALEFVSSWLGFHIPPSAVVALAMIAAGVYYAREIAAFLVGLARWIQIGGLVSAGLLGLAVVGVAAGWLDVSGVARLSSYLVDALGTLSS